MCAFCAALLTKAGWLFFAECDRDREQPDGPDCLRASAERENLQDEQTEEAEQDQERYEDAAQDR
jgi:hypothetical protein